MQGVLVSMCRPPRYEDSESEPSEEERPDNTENHLLELFMFLCCSPAIQRRMRKVEICFFFLRCRATSLLTSSSCGWRTDPETKRMTAECELLPPVGCGKFEHSALEGTEVVSGATDLFPVVDGSIRVFCDLENPDFGRNMDLRGQSYSPRNYGLADPVKDNFAAVKRRPLITVPSLLLDSISCLQKLKGTDDVSGQRWKE